MENIEDQVREKLLLVQTGSSSELEEKEKNELKKRKLLSEVYVHTYPCLPAGGRRGSVIQCLVVEESVLCLCLGQ